MLSIGLKKLENFGDDLEVPKYQTSGSAGMDLQAAIIDDLLIKPRDKALVKTGISISLPNGYEAQIRPRSGLALKSGVTVLNSPGTIDSDYRGEICVILVNLSDTNFVVKRGMRIAQMVISQYEQVSFEVCENLDETARKSAGFGSTGL